ncbi:SDR family NAD(P)-dependent oxidoreductase [Caballeronia sp. 15711]|uniref:SDR family NAD(P)-dependent oxidoreductase n=1 Tax=Caballeronia sp. 15711 TaxID=3391029 RepID=UPI0039E67D7A
MSQRHPCAKRPCLGRGRRFTRDDDAQRPVEEAEQFAAPIDILVNNAVGSGNVKESWANTQPASWASAYDRILLAALRVPTRLLPNMRQTKYGRVINISSLAAKMLRPTGPWQWLGRFLCCYP